MKHVQVSCSHSEPPPPRDDGQARPRSAIATCRCSSLSVLSDIHQMTVLLELELCERGENVNWDALFLVHGRGINFRSNPHDGKASVNTYP